MFDALFVSFGPVGVAAALLLMLVPLGVVATAETLRLARPRTGVTLRPAPPEPVAWWVQIRRRIAYERRAGDIRPRHVSSPCALLRRAAVRVRARVDRLRPDSTRGSTGATER